VVGGIFSNRFIANFPRNVTVKKNENRSTGGDVDKSLRLTFLGYPVVERYKKDL